MTLPGTVEELAAALADAAGRSQAIALCGNSTKAAMGGPIAAADVTISTSKLNRVLQYEPRDLTISVEAGITYRELSRVLAEHRQMLPLDPPFAASATIGGIMATNTSGPRRRQYGTARDLAIGMTFATLEGKLVKSGGMVVKNVAGLDMAKLMIGSFGTLAAIAVVNFRLHPMPQGTRTFVQRFERAEEAVTARDAVVKSVLQPAAIDMARDANGYELLIQAGGSAAVLDRYSRELAGASVLEGEAEAERWESIREYTPRFLEQNPNGAVVRISCALPEVGKVMESMAGPAVARAGSGVCYGYFAEGPEAIGRGVIEFAPPKLRETAELWPKPGSDFAMMKMIKEMFDPRGLLNRGRLYGRI